MKMNKILLGHKYVANFLDSPLKLGMIFRMDDKQFIPALHFNDEFPKIDLGTVSSSGTKGMIKFSEAKNVEISFGGNASTNIGKSEVKMKFLRKHSIAGVIRDATIENIRYQPILSQLKEIWTKHDFINYLKEFIFIFDIVSASSGTLIYSEESNNEIILAQKANESISKIADLGSGNFEYVSNSKRTLEIIRTESHKPLFKTFYFDKNWKPEILG
jgi:hypothetical protein